MENQVTQENLQVVNQVPVEGNVPTKTVFGDFKAPTPAWADWVFRGVFLLTTVLSAYFAATNLLSIEAKYEITLIFKIIVDPIVWAISRGFGIKVDTAEVQKRIEDNKK